MFYQIAIVYYFSFHTASKSVEFWFVTGTQTVTLKWPTGPAFHFIGCTRGCFLAGTINMHEQSPNSGHDLKAFHFRVRNPHFYVGQFLSFSGKKKKRLVPKYTLAPDVFV
jgi:hypothetical protein